MNRLIVFLVFLVSSCASNSYKKEDGRKPLTLDQVLSLSFEKENSDSIHKLFGTPTREMKVRSEETTWVYLDQKLAIPRMVLVFDKNRRLKNILWSIFDSDSEIKIETSKKLFPQAQFKTKSGSSKGLHYIPSEVYYYDDQLGVTLTYNSASNEVEYINLSSAQIESNRQPALK